MTIERYKPHEIGKPRWQSASDNASKALVYTKAGIVNVFSYPGGEHGKPFVRFDLFVWPHEYSAQIDGKNYSLGWLTRLARQFASRCAAQSREDAQKMLNDLRYC